MSTSPETTSPASPAPGAAAPTGHAGFLAGLVLGLLIGLFIGAVAMPIWESRSGSGPVTNTPEPGKVHKPMSPEAREGFPEAPKPAATESAKPEEPPKTPSEPTEQPSKPEGGA